MDEDTPAPVLTTNAALSGAPEESTMTEGEWFIEEDAGGASARFGPPASEARLSLVCDAATRTLTLTRAGNAEGTQTYVLEAGGETARIDMSPTGGELPMLRTEIDRDMPILQEFAEPGSVVTVTVTAPGGEVLRLPGAPGIARVTEACS